MTLIYHENEDASIATRRKQIDDLWKEYRTSFRTDEGWREFGGRLRAKYLEYIDVVSIHSLDNALWLLRNVAMDAQADELLAKWHEAHAKQPELFNLEHVEAVQKLLDPALRDLCLREFIPVREEKHVLEVLARVASGDGWGGDDVTFLEGTQTVDYVNAFRSKELSGAALDGVRFFLKVINPSEKDLAIRAKIQSAMREVANDSALNRDKVRALGIALND